MNSLQQLNGYGQTSITITDDRFATVIFDRMPPLQARDKEQTIVTTSVAVTPGIEITDIINYSTANVRYVVEIKSKDNLLTASSLSWPTLPAYMSVTNVGLVYTVTGFRSASDWAAARAFTWTLPEDFATYPKWWLDARIVYFDEEANEDLEKDWAFYDLKYYEVADLRALATMQTIATHYKNAEVDLDVRFDQFSAAGEELQLIPTNLSATTSIDITARKTIVELFSATLSASFTQTTVPARTRSNIVVFNSACAVSANAIRVRRSPVALSSSVTQTATLSDAPFEYNVRVLGGYTIAGLTGTDIVIDWGDGTQNLPFDSATPVSRSKSYPSGSANDYTIKISGNLTSIRLGNDAGNIQQVLGVTRFNNALQSFSMRHTSSNQFSVVENLFTYAPSQIPRSLTDLSYAFWQCNNFNQDISIWDTSNITNMRDLFSFRNPGTADNPIYNQPLNTWDTSNVTDMQNMFRGQRSFNQPLNNWNTGNVTNMSRMFEEARVFNQALNTWNTAGVTNMNNMFFDARVFNQPLNNWNTSLVTNMDNMFNFALVYDQDISSWCVELIPTKPTGFDSSTPTTWITAEKPNWGAPC